MHIHKLHIYIYIYVKLQYTISYVICVEKALRYVLRSLSFNSKSEGSNPGSRCRAQCTRQ